MTEKAIQYIVDKALKARPTCAILVCSPCPISVPP